MTNSQFEINFGQNASVVGRTAKCRKNSLLSGKNLTNGEEQQTVLEVEMTGLEGQQTDGDEQLTDGDEQLTDRAEQLTDLEVQSDCRESPADYQGTRARQWCLAATLRIAAV